ncbi:hypothetical protein AAG570_010449 [Ranatra chinensis]|uniref:Uncharacterized protein n=1 Tax=Ranatra chinensis TaxID=642074 RepID=A0ABD0ZAX2_9HEMI
MVSKRRNVLREQEAGNDGNRFRNKCSRRNRSIRCYFPVLFHVEIVLVVGGDGPGHFDEQREAREKPLCRISCRRRLAPKDKEKKKYGVTNCGTLSCGDTFRLQLSIDTIENRTTPQGDHEATLQPARGLQGMGQ